jgi:hypothetical protein
MLKTVVETLDGLDEAVKPFYAEADGKFVLQVEGIDAHPEVANLKTAYERVKADKDAAKLAEKKAKDDLASALKDKPDADALVKLRDELEGKINALTTENDGLKGQLTGVTRDRALADALTGAGVTNPTFQKAATAMLAGAVKLVDGKAGVETDMGPVDVAQHVKRWAASEGKDFVTPPAGGGSKGQDNGDKTKVTGNMSGSPEERVAAIKAKMEAEQ